MITNVERYALSQDQASQQCDGCERLDEKNRQLLFFNATPKKPVNWKFSYVLVVINQSPSQVELEITEAKMAASLKRRVGIVGYGAVGRYLANKIITDPVCQATLELSFVCNPRNPQTVRDDETIPKVIFRAPLV